MKKNIILQFTLLLSCVTLKISNVHAVDPSTQAPAIPTEHQVTAIPTENDINHLLSLVTAYQHQVDAIKQIQNLLANEATLPNPPNQDFIQSLLNLLELHKKEANLIDTLRAAIASLQASLTQWDADVASLAIKQSKSAKPKIAKRSIDFGAIKEINKPRGQ